MSVLPAYDQIAVRFHDARSAGHCASVLEEYGFAVESIQRLRSDPWTIFTFEEMPEGEMRQSLALLQRHPDVLRAEPIQKLGESFSFRIDKLLVGLQPGVDAAEVQRSHPDIFLPTPPVLVVPDLCLYSLELLPQATTRQLEELGTCDRRIAFMEGTWRGLRPADLLELEPPTPRAATTPAPPPRIEPRQPHLATIRALEGDQRIAGDPSIRVAIVDSGVDGEHPDLRAALRGGGRIDATGSGNPDPILGWHGTVSAGLAVARPEEGQEGVYGVAPGCSLVGCKFLGTEGAEVALVQLESVLRALDHARQHADVISMSWGLPTKNAMFSWQYPPAPYHEPGSASIRRLLELARTTGRGGKGCVLVAAAGNQVIDFPAVMPGVLSVGAVDLEGQPVLQSDDWISVAGAIEDADGRPPANGYRIDLVAPGSGLVSTDVLGARGQTDGAYAIGGATSGACPLVAGAAALLLSVNPALREDQVRRLLLENTRRPSDREEVGRDPRLGFGLLDVAAAVAAARAERPAEGPPPERGSEWVRGK
ncbi:MAG: S8 family serine peptidase [Verrucomicrobia bacterium]|nr:S8 family serine peptidase [Verrucomicrobiota bacterium]